MASSERREAGSRSAARSRRASSIRTRLMAARCRRAGAASRGRAARLMARRSSTRTRLDEARRGHLRSSRRNAEVSGSLSRSFATAEVSRYATSALIGPHVREHLGETRLPFRRRGWYEGKKVAVRPGRTSLSHQLVQARLGVERHDARDRMAVVSDLDGLPGNHLAEDGARVLAQLSYSDCRHVAHCRPLRASVLRRRVAIRKEGCSVAPRGGQGTLVRWLGRKDSNLRMADPKCD